MLVRSTFVVPDPILDRVKVMRIDVSRLPVHAADSRAADERQHFGADDRYHLRPRAGAVRPFDVLHLVPPAPYQSPAINRPTPVTRWHDPGDHNPFPGTTRDWSPSWVADIGPLAPACVPSRHGPSRRIHPR